uniref:Replication-associated protein n=1 Tax=Genomoviridae sp. TaxID=2202565 RepID=A0A8F5MK94_9VIRU|nr:MAG: replication associated protein [Genomoviridae sp.]
MSRARFEKNAKAFLLTYSKLDDNAQSAFFSRASAHYGFIVENIRTPNCYRLGRERHQDDGVHVHCYVSFDTAVRIQSQFRFDFGGSHPNIRSVSRGHKRTYDYAGKDGDIVAEYGEPPPPIDAGKNKDDGIWAEALRQSTKTDFLDVIRGGSPKDYILFNRQVESFADKHFGTCEEPYRSPTFVDLSGDRLKCFTDQAALGDGIVGHRRKSLILWGPTRTGKTVWARHFYCQTYFNLKQVREDADYAVFDDLAGGFKFWPGYKSWLGAQKEFDITDKYQGKRHVKWGKPGICLMNSDPLFDPHVDTEWLIGNCFIVFVPESEPLVSDVSS